MDKKLITFASHSAPVVIPAKGWGQESWAEYWGFTQHSVYP